MKALFVVLFASVAAGSWNRNLISTAKIQDLFIKFIRHDLNESETKTFSDVIDLLRRPTHITSDFPYGRSKTRMTLDCLICRSAFAAFFDGVQQGQSDEELSQSLTVLCTALGIENHRVCVGAVGTNVPILAYIIKNTPAARPQTFCSLVLQDAHNPNICPLNDDRFEWQVELPEPTSIEQPASNDAAPLTFAILTDAHIDPLYEAFGVSNCGEPTCCRRGQTVASHYNFKSSVNDSVLQESIVNEGNEVSLDLNVVSKIREIRSGQQERFAPKDLKPAGYWGDYNCDTPLWAYDDVIERISEAHKNIDVLYYIGDTIDHGVWETSVDLINDMNQFVIGKIQQELGNIPVYLTIGNHESQPTNQFAPSYVTGEHNTTWLYDGLAEKWANYLSEKALETLRDRGDFAMIIQPGLKVISINNNVAYKYNWWLVFDPLDAKRHLDWMVEELQKSEAAGQKVHILAHIPPGLSDLTLTWTREYNRIINRYSSIIAAEFNGHTHSDEFKIFYNSAGEAISVAYGAGGATSFTNYNLNYKIATVDGATYEIDNIVNYVYNLTEANLTPNRRPHWFQLYDMKNSFRLTDLTPTSLNGLVNSMVTNGRDLLDLYSAFFSKVSDNRWPYCLNNTECKLDNLCKIVVTVLWDRQKCEELRQIYQTYQA